MKFFLPKTIDQSGNDRISLIGLNEFTPGKPLTIKVLIKYKFILFLKLNVEIYFFFQKSWKQVTPSNGEKSFEIKVSHTFNENQSKYY